MFRKGRALQKQQKIKKKHTKNPCKFGVGKTLFQNCSKNGFGGVWGFNLEGFGRFLGSLGALLGTLWALLGRSWGALGRLLRVLGAKMNSKRPFGWILGRFGNGFGRVGGSIFKDLEPF